MILFSPNWATQTGPPSKSWADVAVASCGASTMGEGGKGGRVEIPVIRPGKVRQEEVAPLPDGWLQLWAVSEAGQLFRTRKRTSDPAAPWEAWEDFLAKVPAGP